MKKTLHVIDNPKLDRIFTEAYRNTMRQVALKERDKHDQDYLDIFSELFEKDLYNHDLTSDERKDFMAVFHREIADLQDGQSKSRAKKRKVFLIGGSAMFGILALVFAVYIATARPFMPVSKITSQLDYNLEKVTDGYGSFAGRFYRLLEQQGGKLPETAAGNYRDSMYLVLDSHFDETILKLESGEVRFYDDAKKWASRFPDPEEQSDRKAQAENAFKLGLGAAVGDTLDDVKEGARNFFQKLADFIRDLINRNE